MKRLLLIVPFLFLTGCSENVDYMFTLADGTYVCDRWNYYRKYIDCEHALSGRHIPQIDVPESIAIFKVKEGTK